MPFKKAPNQSRAAEAGYPFTGKCFLDFGAFFCYGLFHLL